MSDTTLLGTSLVFADAIKPVDGFNLVTRFGGLVPADLRKAPNPSHAALTYLLPACNQAVTEAGASDYFDGLLLLSMAYQESKLNPRANVCPDTTTSEARVVRGFVQVMYSTGTADGVIRPPILDFYNPGDSLSFAARYLKWIFERTKKSIPTSPKPMVLGYTVMAYNGGHFGDTKWHDQRLGVNKVGGRKTNTTTVDYARHINAVYGKFMGTNVGPMMFKVN